MHKLCAALQRAVSPMREDEKTRVQGMRERVFVCRGALAEERIRSWMFAAINALARFSCKMCLLRLPNTLIEQLLDVNYRFKCNKASVYYWQFTR